VPFDFAIRDDKKQVQTCLDAINTAVDLNQTANRLILSPTQISALETSHIPALVGNWISHYSTGVTSSFSPYVLLSVLDTIDKLADCFKYDCRCSGSVQRRYYKDLTSKQCGC
jgi:hypothetical protein